jgi:hypothetical protein
MQGSVRENALFEIGEASLCLRQRRFATAARDRVCNRLEAVEMPVVKFTQENEFIPAPGKRCHLHACLLYREAAGSPRARVEGPAAYNDVTSLRGSPSIVLAEEGVIRGYNRTGLVAARLRSAGAASKPDICPMANAPTRNRPAPHHAGKTFNFSAIHASRVSESSSTTTIGSASFIIWAHFDVATLT